MDGKIKRKTIAIRRRKRGGLEEYLLDGPELNKRKVEVILIQ